MGDRIAILGEKSVIKQCDTPERILAAPADEFVDDFIGSGSTLKGLNFERVTELDFTPYPTMAADDTPESGLATLADNDHEWLILLDAAGRPDRWLDEGDLRADGPVSSRGNAIQARVEPNATLHDTLEEMLQSSTGCCCVVDKQGKLEGVVEMSHLISVIRRVQNDAEEHYRGLKANS